MQDEWRFSPGGVVAIIVIILAVAGVAYFMGRFGEKRSAPAPVAVDRPDAGAPAPSVDEHVPTPADTPPTVTASMAVVMERSSPGSTGMQRRSAEIDLAVPTPLRYPTAPPTAPARPVEIALPPTPRPEPPPTEPPPEPEPTDEPDPAEATPTPLPAPPPPMPTPGSYAGGRPASIWSLGSAIAFSFAPRSTHTKQDL